jgi:ABC-type multidrug transport system fused ATPase/permease subunit
MELEPDKLLSKLSMVFQDVYLFNDTIANNIRVGKRDASMEEVKNAAKSVISIIILTLFLVCFDKLIKYFIKLMRYLLICSNNINN